MVIGLAALATTLALVVQVGLMRVAQRRSDAKAAATRDRWRPLLLRHAMGEPVALPALATSEQLVFLVLWNQIADSLRGPSHDLLRDVIVQLDLHNAARRWLAQHNARRQLLGLLTVGHMGASSDWPSLRRRLGDSRTYMSLAAARALLQVDAALAVDPVLDELARRTDWPIARIAGLLRAAGADQVFEPVLRRLQQAETVPSPRVARMLAAIDGVRASATLVRLMQRSDDTELLSTCLQHVQTPAALPRVRASFLATFLATFLAAAFLGAAFLGAAFLAAALTGAAGFGAAAGLAAAFFTAGFGFGAAAGAAGIGAGIAGTATAGTSVVAGALVVAATSVSMDMMNSPPVDNLNGPHATERAACQTSCEACLRTAKRPQNLP